MVEFGSPALNSGYSIIFLLKNCISNLLIMFLYSGNGKYDYEEFKRMLGAEHRRSML